MKKLAKIFGSLKIASYICDVKTPRKHSGGMQCAMQEAWMD